MKFLVDAQLPPRLVVVLREAGHDAIHTTSLPNGNASTDDDLISRAETDDRVIITKDLDFRDGHLLRRSPRRLLLVRTGNVTNAVLLDHVNTHLVELVDAFDEAEFVELGATSLVVHDVRP
ncbi:MAG TPA: DUF5615 family PIN-like protein [Acidimicrobiales bacterium]|nr:DUF5615 family PIN-like protein [Acidimicrobiales bacterium]